MFTLSPLLLLLLTACAPVEWWVVAELSIVLPQAAFSLACRGAASCIYQPSCAAAAMYDMVT